MCGRSSDRQHDLTSQGSCYAGRSGGPSAPVRASAKPTAARLAAVSPVFACTLSSEENGAAPTGFAQPVWLLAATAVRCNMSGPGRRPRMCAPTGTSRRARCDSCDNWRATAQPLHQMRGPLSGGSGRSGLARTDRRRTGGSPDVHIQSPQFQRTGRRPPSGEPRVGLDERPRASVDKCTTGSAVPNSITRRIQ